MNMNPNKSISCDVTNCVHNCGCSDGRYCTKEGGIKIGTHEANPTVPECTDCLSFKLR